MNLKAIVVPRLLVVLLSCLMPLVGCSTGGGAKSDQRYFTWVDEFGRVRQSPINEEENPVEQRAAAVQSKQTTPVQTNADNPVGVKPSSGVHTTNEPRGSAAVIPKVSGDTSTEKVGGRVEAGARRVKPTVREEQPAEPSDLANSPDMSGNTPTNASPEPRATPEGPQEVTVADPNELPSVQQPDRAPPLTEVETGRASERAGDRQQRDAVSAPQGPDEDSEYTLENYPDGNELAKQGFVRDGDPLPYFTWRDAQGNVRVDYYRPEGGFDKPQHERSAPALTSALVIDGSRQAPVEQANTDALAVLGIDKTETLMDAWVRQCCQALPRKDLAEWDASREFQLDLDELAPEFRFSTGNSVYRLVALPEPGDSAAFVLQVRSYVQHGVFLPTLAFLDEDMGTRRLVTEMAFEYQPESWHSHGYLEARVPVFPSQGDRWLLIMSRDEDQAGQTVFETEAGTTVIRHSGHGLLGLAQLGG